MNGEYTSKLPNILHEDNKSTTLAVREKKGVGHLRPFGGRGKRTIEVSKTQNSNTPVLESFSQ
jgi:hypothetical protein